MHKLSYFLITVIIDILCFIIKAYSGFKTHVSTGATRYPIMPMIKIIRGLDDIFHENMLNLYV